MTEQIRQRIEILIDALYEMGWTNSHARHSPDAAFLDPNLQITFRRPLGFALWDAENNKQTQWRQNMHAVMEDYVSHIQSPAQTIWRPVIITSPTPSNSLANLP